MIMTEKNRKEICKYIFQEGVCYAKKDFNLAKHPDIDVPNLQVIKLMQSFKSKELVRETFAWMHYYWYLTNAGIDFLRTYLNLPSEIVPNTLVAVPWAQVVIVQEVHPVSKVTDQDLVIVMGTVEVHVDQLVNLVVRRVELQLTTNLHLAAGEVCLVVVLESLVVVLSLLLLVHLHHLTLKNFEVLNGIAWDSDKQRIFVTGKLWPKIFEIKLDRKKDHSNVNIQRLCIPNVQYF